MNVKAGRELAPAFSFFGTVKTVPYSRGGYHPPAKKHPCLFEQGCFCYLYGFISSVRPRI